MIAIILPLATKLCTKLPQIFQLSFLLQAWLHIRILQQYNRITTITTLGRKQVFREHIYPVNIIHSLIHSRLRYHDKWYFGSGHDVSPSIQTLMKSNGPTPYSLLLLDLYITFIQSHETVHAGCLYHCVQQESVNLPFLLTLLWFEAPFAKASQETYTIPNSTANIFIILFVTRNLSVKKCTLFYRWVQRTISQSSLLFFEHPVSDQHVVHAHNTTSSLTLRRASHQW